MNHTQDLSRIIGELTPFTDTDKQMQRQQRRPKPALHWKKPYAAAGCATA